MYSHNTVYRYMIAIFFFFSSRRRHTRLQGDWSSDVCSSDLRLVDARGRQAAAHFEIGFWREFRQVARRLRTGRLRLYQDQQYQDRKSTRLNSSHLVISYAVFCLKKKNEHNSSLVYTQTLILS